MIRLIPLPGICAANVCMYCVCYVCICIYIYIYIYICICICICICMYECMHVCMYYVCIIILGGIYAVNTATLIVLTSPMQSSPAQQELSGTGTCTPEEINCAAVDEVK